MKEHSSDKMNQNLDHASPVREHEKKTPNGQREKFSPILTRGKKCKKITTVFPSPPKTRCFFIYNNNIGKLCPASLLNQRFLTKKSMSDQKFLIKQASWAEPYIFVVAEKNALYYTTPVPTYEK